MPLPKKPNAKRTNLNLSEHLRLILAMLGDGQMVTGVERIELLISLLAKSHPSLARGSHDDQKLAAQLKALKIPEIYADSIDK